MTTHCDKCGTVFKIAKSNCSYCGTPNPYYEDYIAEKYNEGAAFDEWYLQYLTNLKPAKQQLRNAS